MSVLADIKVGDWLTQRNERIELSKFVQVSEVGRKTVVAGNVRVHKADGKEHGYHEFWVKATPEEAESHFKALEALRILQQQNEARQSYCDSIRCGTNC